MGRALALAARGVGAVSPNPAVGAVLVARGEVIAEGYHRRFGGPHAERHLFASLGKRAIPRDAILYLTLEPCTYEGKTPACIDLLLDSPIGKFVIAMADPNPRVRGRGIRRLRADGREVTLGVMREEVGRLIAPFTWSQRSGRARVVLKMGSTIDGRLADHRGRSRWITSPDARSLVGGLRGLADAIVVGRGTVEADDPRLRSPGPAGHGVSRIVLSTSLAFDPECRLARIWRRESPQSGTTGWDLRKGNWVARQGRGGRLHWTRAPRLIVATTDPSVRRLNRFERSGWEVWRLASSAQGIDLQAFAERASDEGLIDLFVEPGPTLAASFLDSGPVDRILLFLAPSIVGGGMGWTDRLSPRALPRAIRGAYSVPLGRVGDDLCVALEGIGGRAIVPAHGPRNALHSP
jgi:diaminohydroxyphosphoribosylaminopyrimidine deaminase / 5-amino-6-(5-phosphoribosylamino)uracil reductase